MKLLLIRGGFLNKYEGQNFELLTDKFDITAVSSQLPIHDKFKFPVKKFYSPYDVIIFACKFGLIGAWSARVIRWFCNRAFGDSHFLFGLEKFIKETGPYDIGWIADTHYGYCAQAADMKKKGSIKKIISTCWETIVFNNQKTIKKKYIKRQVMENADLFTCPTNRAKKALIKEGIDEEKIKVIPVGVNMSKFRPAKKSKKNKYLQILFVGRLVPEKGIFDLLKIYRNLQEKQIKTRLKIVGDGPLKQYIKDEIKRFNLKNIRFKGSVDYQHMPAVYQSSDIMLVLSKKTGTWEEQYCMASVEAMACGLPVLYYSTGALPEVISDFGMASEAGDINSIVNNIVQMVRSPDKLFKIRSSARKNALKKFDARKTARMYALCSKI